MHQYVEKRFCCVHLANIWHLSSDPESAVGFMIFETLDLCKCSFPQTNKNQIALNLDWKCLMVNFNFLENAGISGGELICGMFFHHKLSSKSECGLSCRAINPFCFVKMGNCFKQCVYLPSYKIYFLDHIELNQLTVTNEEWHNSPQCTFQLDAFSLLSNS